MNADSSGFVHRQWTALGFSSPFMLKTHRECTEDECLVFIPGPESPRTIMALASRSVPNVQESSAQCRPPKMKRSNSACVQLEDLEPGGVSAQTRAHSSRPYMIQDLSVSVAAVGGYSATVKDEPAFSPILNEEVTRHGLPGQTDSRSAHSVAMDSFTTAASSLSLDGDFCKICHCGSEPNMPLINPCLCSGSLKHVHQECLQRWIKSSDIKRCELCKYPFTMQSKVKPFCQWEKLDMTLIERRKLCCSVSFHIIAITCVIWSLYVLIDKTAQEIQSGELQWPFWTKLVVVAIGFTGGLVFMYIQCKVYLHLCRKWKAYNRIIVVQDAPEGIHGKHKSAKDRDSRRGSQACEKPESVLSGMASHPPEGSRPPMASVPHVMASPQTGLEAGSANNPTTNNAETQTSLRAVNFMEVLARRNSDGVRDPAGLEANSMVARILEDIQDVEKNTIFFTDYEIEVQQSLSEKTKEPVLACDIVSTPKDSPKAEAAASPASPALEAAHVSAMPVPVEA